MKKRTLSILLSLCLAVTLVTPAVAAEENGTLPEVTDMSIVYNGDDATITKTESNGSFLFTASGGTKVVDYTTTVTLSSDAVFTATTPGEGDLYVSAVGDNTVTLKFNLTVGGVNINTDQFALTLEKQENNVWRGGFSNAADLTLETLAGYLLGLDSDTFYIYHVAAVMVDNLRRLLLGINLSDKAIMDFDFPGVGFPV